MTLKTIGVQSSACPITSPEDCYVVSCDNATGKTFTTWTSDLGYVERRTRFTTTRTSSFVYINPARESSPSCVLKSRPSPPRRRCSPVCPSYFQSLLFARFLHEWSFDVAWIDVSRSRWHREYFSTKPARLFRVHPLTRHIDARFSPVVPVPPPLRSMQHAPLCAAYCANGAIFSSETRGT